MPALKPCTLPSHSKANRTSQNLSKSMSSANAEKNNENTTTPKMH